MSENERHTMQLVATHGEQEEWFCPICGRRFVMTWPPNYHRTILERGDETAFHTGGKSFAEWGDQLHLEAGEMRVDLHDPRLDVFDEWLKGREK